VNPRIQVEHTVTEVVTGIDIVKAQIHILDGAVIGTPESGVPKQEDIHLNGNAMQCRITTEDPEQNFIPDYGRITAYREATGFGIRLDGGTAYAGAVITRFYDPLLEKVTAGRRPPLEAIARMHRALREFRIRGVATNLTFLETIITHPRFRRQPLHDALHRHDAGAVSAGQAAGPRDQAAHLSRRRHRQRPPGGARPAAPPADAAKPVVPEYRAADIVVEGSKQKLDERTRRSSPLDARAGTGARSPIRRCATRHQSLLATRMRSFDIARIAGAYARGLPQLFSLECWGGATFDVSMRFLNEDPWERLPAVREARRTSCSRCCCAGRTASATPTIPTMSSNLRPQAAKGGIDIFRVFDCLNWVENMRVSMDAVDRGRQGLRGAICYTGDLLDPERAKYDLKYYVGLAKDLEKAGAHVLGAQGHGRAAEAGGGARALQDAEARKSTCRSTSTPTTRRVSRRRPMLAAVEAGVDAVDAAMDALSGTTSQP
jgi:pyruvate carboxylase